MDIRTKLAIVWFTTGLLEIIFARLFILRKQDLFTDPNARLAAMWIKPVKKIQGLANAAMDAGMLSRTWLVSQTAKMITQMGLCQIGIGGLLVFLPWSTTTAIVISAIGFAFVLIYFILSFTFRCIAFSKKG